MSNEILNSLIKEYEQKKLLAELDLEKRKNYLYKKVTQFKPIEDDLNQFAINTAKNILKNNEASINELEIKASQLKKEKIEILKELNLPTDYLQPFYECKICNDTGYIMNNNYKTEMCNCLKQKLLNYSFNKSNMSNLDKENFNTFNENIFSDEVDLSKYKFNISPRKNIINIKNKCIYGKTFMSNCIANELLKNVKTVLYQTAPILLENVINYKMSKQKDSLDNIYKSILDSDLLIIDDLGTESLNSMKLSELFTILNTRILNLNHKPTKTIISTNLNINDIFNNYEERIGSRIAGYYDIYCFFGDDLRFKRGI